MHANGTPPLLAAPETAPARAKRQTHERQQVSLEQQLWWAHLRACGLLVLLAASLVLLGMLWIDARRVQIEVQLVQVEDGQIKSVGLPMDVLAYTPTDAQWQAMIRDWLKRVRVRNDEPVSTKVLWQDAAHYTCGEALRRLDYDRVQERAFEATGRTVLLGSITLTKVAPLVYQAIWEEITTDRGQQQTHTWTGSFRVERTRPKRAADNPLGQCIRWYNLTER